jgi:hypothetical protein
VEYQISIGEEEEEASGRKITTSNKVPKVLRAKAGGDTLTYICGVLSVIKM